MSEYKAILDKDEVKTTTFEESGNTATITTTQDTAPILEQNKKEYNSGINAPNHSAIGRKVASVPLVLWEKWKQETNGAIAHDPQLLARYLNNPDHKYLRTHKGRV